MFVLIKYVHLRGFGFVLPIEELWQGSALNGMNTWGKEVGLDEDSDKIHLNYLNTFDFLSQVTSYVLSRAETIVDFHFHQN